MNFLSHVGRFVVAALVLMVVGWIVPQFTVGGFWSALILALVIALLGWVVEGIFGKKATPFGRGIVGFIVSAVVIWVAQFVVSGVSVSILGAILAALVIGIIDLFLPHPLHLRPLSNKSSSQHRTPYSRFFSGNKGFCVVFMQKTQSPLYDFQHS